MAIGTRFIAFVWQARQTRELTPFGRRLSLIILEKYNVNARALSPTGRSNQNLTGEVKLHPL